MKENTAVHYFLQEIKESLGISFGMSVLAGAICIILDCGTDVLFVMKPVQDLSVFSYIGTYFPSGFYGTFVFAPLMALPYGLSYYRDYNAGIIQTVATRIGVSVYCIGKVLGAFLGVELSSGSHTVTMDYFPKGLKEGVLLSAAALVLFVLSCLIGSLYQKHHTIKRKEESQ